MFFFHVRTYLRVYAQTASSSWITSVTTGNTNDNDMQITPSTHESFYLEKCKKKVKVIPNILIILHLTMKKNQIKYMLSTLTRTSYSLLVANTLHKTYWGNVSSLIHPYITYISNLYEQTFLKSDRVCEIVQLYIIMQKYTL